MVVAKIQEFSSEQTELGVVAGWQTEKTEATSQTETDLFSIRFSLGESAGQAGEREVGKHKIQNTGESGGRRPPHDITVTTLSVFFPDILSLCLAAVAPPGNSRGSTLRRSWTFTRHQAVLTSQSSTERTAWGNWSWTIQEGLPRTEPL